MEEKWEVKKCTRDEVSDATASLPSKLAGRSPASSHSKDLEKRLHTLSPIFSLIFWVHIASQDCPVVLHSQVLLFHFQLLMNIPCLPCQFTVSGLNSFFTHMNMRARGHLWGPCNMKPMFPLLMWHHLAYEVPKEVSGIKITKAKPFPLLCALLRSLEQIFYSTETQTA